jgi:hypothetical protein
VFSLPVVLLIDWFTCTVEQGQQLFTLKKYAEDITSGKLFLDSINTLNNPEVRRSYDKKVKALRLLDEFRHLNESK